MSHDVIKSTFHCTFDNSHFHHQHHHHIACVSTIRGCLPTQKLLLTNKPIPFLGDEEKLLWKMALSIILIILYF